ncbi:hypothetical protein C1Y40_05572 [Mycobacterium talmoniae]|uniref:Uncharacterized protein n=1 Tax=Mycobacterium talmoniae TaxID=1858794 RepID=A0A2S8BC74_9MYCO|nr:hypothetical protein C1Y40_05572 [Mycobacterium talmoniae]
MLDDELVAAGFASDFSTVGAGPLRGTAATAAPETV